MSTSEDPCLLLGSGKASLDSARSSAGAHPLQPLLVRRRNVRMNASRDRVVDSMVTLVTPTLAAGVRRRDWHHLGLQFARCYMLCRQSYCALCATSTCVHAHVVEWEHHPRRNHMAEQVSPVLDAVSENGSVYRIDFVNRTWKKHSRHGWTDPAATLGELKVGTELVEPWSKPEAWENADRPVIGKHLYISSLNVWWVSKVIVKIVETTSEAEFATL